MNNKKVLSAAILLILTKSALGIEVEPNNDSGHANKLGKENVGKLNRASDVDFFSIDSCVKNDKKQCVKYTSADEKLNTLNKAGTDKRREEVSVSFTCNNRSASTITSSGIPTGTGNGWFLGIHDSNGELQETYPVKPEDCIISDKTLGSFNFVFPSLETPNYYVSVVSDCAAPIYNTVTDPKDSTKTIVNVNKFVTVALAKQTDIDAAKAELVTAQKAISYVKTDLDLAENGLFVITASSQTTPAIYAPSFLFINSNVNIKNLIDALALTNDITSLASMTLTPATNISAALSAAKAIQIAAYSMQTSIYTYGKVLIAEEAERVASAEIKSNELAAKEADNLLSEKTTALDNAKKELSDAKVALKIANTAVKDADLDVKNTKITFDNAVKEFNAADIAWQKATEDKKADALTAKNDAEKIKTEADTAKIKAENTRSKAGDVKTDAETTKTIADAAISPAETAKNEAEKNKLAIEKLKLETDKIVENHKAAKAKDDDAKTKLTEALKAVDDAVKSLTDTVKANINSANAAENFGKRFDTDACKDYNVGIYTLKDNPDNEIKSLEDITSKDQKNLGLEQSGQIKSKSIDGKDIDDMDIYVVDSDGTAEVPLLFTCSALALRQTNDWKVSIFNDTNGLVSATLINGSSCGSVFIGDKGGQSIKLPKGSQRYYLAVESACASSTKKDCVVDTSEYSILRDVDKVYSGKLAKKTIDTKSADLKLTNCGLNNNAVISIHTENVNFTDAAKLPINVQIGSTACRILTPELLAKDTIIGSVAAASKIIDSTAKTKDSAAITLADCGGDAKSKVTLTGTRLDLVNLNPNVEIDSVVIPIKVSIGDFRCESQEVFAIDRAAAETIYSNVVDASAPTATTTADDTALVIKPITTKAFPAFGVK
jgi:hypothetical protein